jgi:hypothetical protein
MRLACGPKPIPKPAITEVEEVGVNVEGQRRRGVSQHALNDFAPRRAEAGLACNAGFVAG